MNIDELLGRFLLQLRANGRSPHTQDQYARYVTLLNSWLVATSRSTNMGDIDHTTIAEFLTSPTVRERRGGGPRRTTSTNGVRTSMRVFFGWTHAAGYATRNAAALVHRARCSPRLGRVLSDDDVCRLEHVLATQADERDRIMFRLALGCGLRVGSLVALQAEDIAGGEILVRRAKGDVALRVFVPRALRPDLDRYVVGRTGPLFPGPDGRPLTPRSVARRLRMWCERARIAPASPHALRRTFGTDLYRRCKDPLVVQRGLGHRSLQSVLPYISGIEARLREVVGA